MTGIAGIYSLDPLGGESTDLLLTEMSQQLSYQAGDRVDRWQDERIAIARVHHGYLHPAAQPVFNEDGTLWAVLDGEVFGYDLEKKDLEQAGHCFRLSESDAEFCLHLYEQCGVEGLARLNGSFLLALYKRTTDELLLASDRFLARLLFYHYDDGQLLFGSQMRALLSSPCVPRQLDLQAVFEFFTFQRVLGDRTFYQDVKVLPSASVLRLGPEGTLSVSRYWNADPVDSSHPERYHVDALANALRMAVRRKTRGEHRFGILLSGGLDARTVVTCSEKPLTAITFADFYNREVRTAQRIAEAAGCPHVFIQRSLDHYANLVDDAVDIGDGMLCFHHAHSFGLFEEIRSHCDILLDGLEFDVRLKGFWAIYRTLSWLGRKSYTPLLIKTSQVDSLDIWGKMRLNTLPSQPDRLFRDPHRSSFDDVILSSIRKMLGPVEGEDLNHVVDRLLANGSFFRPSLYLMTCGTCAFMEHRSIIQDNDLLDVAHSIPLEWRATGRVLKKALKKLSPELAAIPYSNSGLRTDMPVWPEWVWTNGLAALRQLRLLPRPKLPHPAYRDTSWPNKGVLIRTNERLRTLVADTLHDPACIPPDLFDVRAVAALWQEHLNREADRSETLLLLLTFGRWHKRYGPN